MNDVPKSQAEFAPEGKRVFIVDATGDAVGKLAETLAAAGYHITTVKDSADAGTALARLVADAPARDAGRGSPSGFAMIVPKGNGRHAVIFVTANPVAASSRPEATILSALDSSFDFARAPQDWAANEKGRRKTEELLRAILENATAVIYAKDREGRYLFVNRQFEKIFGLTSGSLEGKFDHEIFPPGIADAFHRNDLRVLHSGHPVEIEETAPHADGLHTYASVKFPLFDADGTIGGVCGISTDITERKREAEQLRRIQQMEAIGQLTGGVAHDFNNLNAVIMGNLELLEEHVEAETPEKEMVRRAIEAARRGVMLIERLLAFSRKQILQPRSMDVNALVQSTTDFLRRSVGENIDICSVLGRDVWPAFVDPGQFESAIINLAVNARDAMPRGGALTIETRNREVDEYEALHRSPVMPGKYVELLVKDTGAGAGGPIQEQVFETFGAAKDAGTGAGLGLGMVHEFAARSGGHVLVERRPDGTTVSLLIPRSSAGAPEAERESAAARHEARAGETILVVEDDPEVRNLTATFLKGLGYGVLEAGDAAAALALLRGAPVVDLLLTDVMLPGSISGRDLAIELRAKYPETRVLFMSGYADTGLSPDDLAAIDARLIDKPFSRSDLAMMVRGSIDAVPVRPQSPRLS